MIKLIVFDLDGVLIKTKELHYISLNKALSEIAPDFIISRKDHLTIYDGLPTKRKLAMLEQKGLDPNLFEEINKRKQVYTLEYIRSSFKKNDNLYEAFSKLSSEDYKIYVASNAIRRTIVSCLYILGIIEYVDNILSNEDVKNGKPNPEIYLRSMIHAGCSPDETLIFEDSSAGKLAALRSGAHLVPIDKPEDVVYDYIKLKLNKVDNMIKKEKWAAKDTIVLIPMAGAGSRFEKAGYTFPKPLVEVHDKPMIQFVVENLNIDAEFVYIVQKTHYEKYNLQFLLNLITPGCKIVQVDHITEGAACTTLLAKEFINFDNKHLLIANSDQYVDWDSHDFFYTAINRECDGAILTVESTHPKWSFARIEDGFVTEIAEKKPISNGSEVLPPWNTESMNGTDVNAKEGISDEDAIPSANVTYPNIYGFKTPEKLLLKMVDGNAKCNHRWKRIELMSNFNWILMKDDFLHPGGQWAHPDCGCGGGDVSKCVDENGNPIETDQCPTPSDLPKCANPYYKQKSECRPYSGPGTPQNNKCAIDQGGMQFLDMAGNTIIMDSSVEQPTLGQGVPWERGTESFDFGCTDKYTGKMKFISATGHRIELNDVEETSEYRGPDNGIRLITATGNYVVLCDDTNKSGIATENRGIWLGSTSEHVIQMCDDENDQSSPPRTEIDPPGNEATDTVDPTSRPDPQAKKAYIRIRSGYGLEITMADFYSQQKTMQQYIQIFSPQTDNTERGPHIMRFQEAPSGPGQVDLIVGGNYICATYDNHITLVGRIKNPSDKITNVTGVTYINTVEEYINAAQLHEFIAKEIILLLAGQDCPEPDGSMGPCPMPVLVYEPQKDGPGRILISDRLIGSASPQATIASIFMMQPFQQ